MTEQDYRNKIRIFSTFLSILVIWVHSVNVKLFFADDHPKLLDLVQAKIISLGQIAVPAFFILSAYLFFRNLDEHNFVQKIKRRFASLILPFFVWNLIYYIAYFLASRIPALSRIIGKSAIAFTWGDFLKAVFLYQYNFVFWFVFQLILLILLTPILYRILGHQESGILFLFAILIYMLFFTQILWLNADALFYFSLGAFFARFHKKAVESKFTWKRLWSGLILFLLARFLYPIYLAKGMPVLAVLSRSMASAGLWLCLYVKPNLHLPHLFQNSFFIYAIHFLIARMINKSFAYFFPREELLAMWLFLCMPFLILLISEGIVRILKRIANPLYKVLSGNRG